MANERRDRLSSGFDDMLDRNRQALDALYGGRTAPERAPRDRQPSAPEPATPASSDPKRFLDDRYGNGWAYEITERRRDGDEVIVLLKLTVADQNISKSQFGSARIGGAGNGAAGTVDGVAFTLSPGPARADSEEAAYADEAGEGADGDEVDETDFNER